MFLPKNQISCQCNSASKLKTFKLSREEKEEPNTLNCSTRNVQATIIYGILINIIHISLVTLFLDLYFESNWCYENLAKDYETKWKHFLRQFELKSISIIIRNVKLLSKSQYCKKHLSVETVCTMLVYLCNVMPSDSSLRVYPRKVLRTVLGQVRSDWRSGLEQHPTNILRWISGHIWKICWLGVVVLFWKLDSYRRQIIFTYKF